MTRPTLLIGVAVLAAATASLAAAPPRVLYERAQAREAAVRTKLDAPRPGEAAFTEARRVVASYERLALEHPANGYSDNALWQAARLSADLWARYAEDRDRTAAVRLYKALVRSYPSSSLVAKSRVEGARLEAPARRPDAAAPPAQARTVPAPKKADVAASKGGEAGERVLAVPDNGRMKIRDLDAPPAATAAPAPEPGMIRSITRSLVQGIERITIELDREVSYHDERIGDPDRVFVDVHGVRVAREARRTQKFTEGFVRRIRVGDRPDDTTRIVLDLDRTGSHSVFMLYNPYRVVIDCERWPAQESVPVVAATAFGTTPTKAPMGPRGTSVPRWSEAPVPGRRMPAALVATEPTSAAAASAAVWTEPMSTAPFVSEQAPAPRAAHAEPDPDASPLPARRAAAEPAAPAPALPVAPAANLQGRFSLSRQLGLSIARIVIDPGHGGHDPGAQTRGLNEADLVLDVALRLEQLLLKSPGVEVVLTRRTDVFIPLEERTALANRESADLFLSIHANASRNQRARGIETYFLNFASNPDGEAVAARENAASGRTMHSLPDIVKAITLNNKLDESRDFATMVQRSMIERLRTSNNALKDLGVKQAPFVVLIGAAMPSVLAEISFVTHPQEGRLLKGAAYRQKIAEALYDGVAQYQRSLKRVRTVATQ